MSYNGSNEMDFSQLLSGYSNGSGSLNQNDTNHARAVQKADNATEQSPHLQQDQFSVRTFQSGPGTNGSTLGSLPQAASYQPQQGLPQHTLAMMHPPQHPVAPFAAATTSSINISSGLPTGWQNDEFWSQQATLALPDDQRFKGTFAQLYRFPDAHKEIWYHYNAWHGATKQNIAQPQPQRPIPDYQMAQVTNAAKVLRQAVTTTSAPKKKPRKMVASAGMNQVPAYTPDNDLDTPQKCRDYLAYIDPADVHHLRFENDDWQNVLMNRKHEFIGGMFEALTHPYSQQPPSGITLNQQARENYYRQQDTQLTKVKSQLQTPTQLKAAKALCSLLFDAVVYVHEVGVPKEVLELYQWYALKERQVDRKCRLNLESICSSRLEKIIEAIKANKLIAMDVLEQTNFHRMARDPDFYLLEKFTYLRSNKTRQENIDRHGKEDVEKARFEEMMTQSTDPTPAKGKRRGRQAVDDSEDEMELEEWDEAFIEE